MIEADTGNETEERTPEATFCIYCGSPLEADSVFCLKCGKPVAKESAATATATTDKTNKFCLAGYIAAVAGYFAYASSLIFAPVKIFGICLYLSPFLSAIGLAQIKKHGGSGKLLGIAGFLMSAPLLVIAVVMILVTNL